ncbi:MAG: hypothetical protein Q9Q40_08065 [Acidobacteriota bacterium]|nr:hypothetical protein [Acidobacteriota bacterium]
MPRNRRIGIEVSPQGVRAVLVEGRRGGWSLLAHAGRDVGDRGGPAEALAETIAELGTPAPCRILLLGSQAVSHHLRFPPMPRRDLLRAASWRLGHAGHGGGDMLQAEEILRRPREGVVDLRVVRLPREPLESWAGLLETLGCPVEGVIVPAALAACSRDEDDGPRLLVLPTGGRLCLVLAGGRGEVVVQESPRLHPGDDDPVSVIERRLDDIAQLQAFVAKQSVPPRRVIVCGGAAEVEPTVEQLRMALAGEAIAVEREDPWEALEPRAAGHDGPPPAFAGALLAALGKRVEPLLVPGPAARRRRERRAEGRTLAAAGLIAALSLVAALGTGVYRARMAARVEALAREAARVSPAAARPVEPAPPRRVSAADWSALLREAGLLVRPGVDYETLVVDLSAVRPRLALEGTVRGAGPARLGEILTGLHEDLFASPFVQGLPRLAAALEDGDKARFALEDEVTPWPRED